MSSSVVRRWVRLFTEGHENVRDDSRNGRPSVVNEDLLRAVEEKMIHHYAIFLAFFSNFSVTSSQNYV